MKTMEVNGIRSWEEAGDGQPVIFSSMGFPLPPPVAACDPEGLIGSLPGMGNGRLRSLHSRGEGARLTYDQYAKHSAACLWCLIGSAATFASAVLVVPEAREAVRHVARGKRKAATALL